MRGTFLSGDILIICSEVITNIRVGDVVVYTGNHELRSKEIVHRVIALHPNGLVTQGDSSRSRDVGVVDQRALVGRVCFRECRDGRRFVVHGGKIGELKGRLLNLFWCFRATLSRAIEKPYSLLNKVRIVNFLWRPKIVRVLITTENGFVIHYIHNRRVIARELPEHGKFECRKPWGLVIQQRR